LTSLYTPVVHSPPSAWISSQVLLFFLPHMIRVQAQLFFFSFAEFSGWSRPPPKSLFVPNPPKFRFATPRSLCGIDCHLCKIFRVTILPRWRVCFVLLPWCPRSSLVSPLGCPPLQMYKWRALPTPGLFFLSFRLPVFSQPRHCRV